MKIKDEVQYDIFRRVLQGLVAKDGSLQGPKEPARAALIITNEAINTLLEAEVISE